VYSSSEGKALATVRAACERHGLKIKMDGWLREARRPIICIEDHKRAVCLYLEHPEDPPVGWEGEPAARSRMAGCVD
jgi:hypothetical protein